MLGMESILSYIPYILGGVVIVLGWFYYYAKSKHSYWESQGVPGPAPHIFYGHTRHAFKTGSKAYFEDLVEKYGKVFGTYEGYQPVLNVADPKLIKIIQVKEFNAFEDRQTLGISEFPLRSTLMRLKGDHWRRVRAHLTPAFSSGKLKQMITAMNKCATTMMGHMKQEVDKEGKVPIKKYTGAFTLDNIAATGFGFELDSQADPKNEFVKNAGDMFNVNFKNPIFMILMVVPRLHKIFFLLGYRMFPEKVKNFFMGILNQCIEGKKDGKKRQLDFLQVMLDSEISETEAHNLTANADYDETIPEAAEGVDRKDSGKSKTAWKMKKGMTREEILANGLIFFMAGYETVSTSVGFLLYNLARNQEIQDKVVNEVLNVMGKSTTVDYNHVNQMTYLRMCIDETLRIHSPALRVNRECTRPIKLGNIDIPKRCLVNMLGYSVHHMEEYWPEPEAFDPDRFTKEAKEARDPFVYQPFGQGPRNCIGMRMALLQITIVAARLLREYKLSPVSQEPLKFKAAQMLTPEKPIVLKFEPRAAVDAE